MYTSMMRRALFGSGDTATLSLDLSSGTLPTEITFTRADSTARATYIDASGLVATVATAGAARFDYTSGTAKGLLIEASSTNICLQSQTLTTGWLNSNMNTPTVPPSPPADPFGGTSASWKLVAASGSALHSLRHSVLTYTAGAHTFSFWAKKEEYDRVVFSDPGSGLGACTFVLTGAGTATVIAGGVTPTNPTITSYSGGWYRCSVTMVTAAINYAFGVVGYPTGTTPGSFGAIYNGDGTSGVYVTGMQIEVGSIMSSYIKTTTAALTRLADDAVIRSTAWTGLYSKPGTIVVEYYRGEYGAGDRSVLAIDTAATKHIHLKHANASAASGIYNSAGLGVANKISGNVTGLNKAAFNWSSANPSNIKYALNGNALVANGSSDIGATLGTWMTIGSASTTGVSGSGTWEGYLNNSIKSVKYYSELLSDAEMIAKTT
jgi:hypothetical protein